MLGNETKPKLNKTATICQNLQYMRVRAIYVRYRIRLIEGRICKLAKNKLAAPKTQQKLFLNTISNCLHLNLTTVALERTEDLKIAAKFTEQDSAVSDC